MIIPPFDKKKLANQLSLLDNKRKLAFCASCCQRLLPNYSAFVRDTGWGDAAPLKDALEFIWSSVSGHSAVSSVVEKFLELCERVIPDGDDFESLYVSFAQDACLSICATLDFLIDNDLGKAVLAGMYATDSVDLYVQEIENMDSRDPDLEHKILTHTLMQRELRKQQEDLNVIKNAAVLDDIFIATLKESWGNNGRSNLDLA